MLLTQTDLSGLDLESNKTSRHPRRVTDKFISIKIQSHGTVRKTNAGSTRYANARESFINYYFIDGQNF